MNRKNILFLTNTYMQLIIAIQIKKRLKSDCNADIVISNHSVGSDKVADRLADLSLFDNVYYIIDRDGEVQRNKLHKIGFYMPMLFSPRRKLEDIVELRPDYDEIYFNNAIIFTHMIVKRYSSAKFFRFEEGFSTYTKPLIENRISKAVFRFFFGDISKKIQGYYLFHRELFDRQIDCPIYDIPLISKTDEELKGQLNHIFDFVPENMNLDGNHIFFEESFRVMNDGIDDVGLVEKITELLGDKKLLIKRHPRVIDEPFGHLNVRTWDEIRSIPWEVVAMNIDASELKLYTITSGSVLASVLYFDDEVETYFLYKCIEQKSPMLNDEFEVYIEKLKAYNSHIVIPEKISDIGY